MTSLKAVLLSVSIQLLAFILIRRIAPSGIVFYQGLLVAGVAGCLHAALAIKLRGLEVGLMEGLLAFFIGYSFFFTVPTTVDRAYSVKFLLALDQQGKMRSVDVKRWFSRHFVENGAVEKRLYEQEASGTLTQDATGEYRLTPQGKLLVRTFDSACRLFNCQDKPPASPAD